MIKDKIKVSFEITDVWNRFDYRSFIRSLETNIRNDVLELNKNCNLEFFLISNNNSSQYIYLVGTQLGLNDGTHTIVTNFRQDKVDAIIANNIDIHFDGDNKIIDMLEATDTLGVLVDYVQDRFHVRQNYVTKFYDGIKNIIDGEV